jgi:TP901 family phage tail tape measure protein
MGLELARAFVTVRGDASRVQRDFRSMQGPMTKQATKLGGVVGRAFSAAMMVVGVAGFSQILRMAGREAVGFEKKMVDVRANARLLGDQGTKAFQQLNRTARMLGATTQFTAVQAAQALDKMVLAGLDAREAMEAVPSVLNLAASANLELAESAKIVVDNMRKYGLEAADTGKIADFLSSAQSRAQITARDLAQGLLSLGAISTSMNASFQDTVALLTGMGRAGTEMSRAGTALAVALGRLARQPKEVENALAELNIEVQDFVGPDGAFQIIPLFKAISTSLDPNPIVRGRQAMELFGARGREILGILNLMRQGTFVEETQVGLMNDLGRAARVSEAKLSTFWGMLKKVRSALGELFIAGLTPVLKSLEPFLERVRGAAILIAELSESTHNIIRANWDVVKVFVQITKSIGIAIIAWGAYQLAMKAVAVAQAIVLALSGVGIKKLIVGAIAATAAVIALNVQFNELKVSTIEATEKAKQASSMMEELGNQSSGVDNVKESVDDLAAAMKGLRRVSEEAADGMESLITMNDSLDRDLVRTRFGIQETFKIPKQRERKAPFLFPGEEVGETRRAMELRLLEKQLDELKLSEIQIAALKREFGSLAEAGLFLSVILEELDPKAGLNAVKQDLLDLKQKLLAMVEAGRLTNEQLIKLFVAAEEKSPLGEALQELKELKDEAQQLREGFGELEIAKREFAKTPFVTPDQIDEFEKLKGELIGLKELEKLKEKWESVLQTPLEKMKEGMEELRKLKEAGDITPEMFERGKTKLEREAGIGGEFLGAGRFGFADFGKQLQDAILKKDDPQKRIEENTRRAAKAGEDTVLALKEKEFFIQGGGSIYAPEL